MQWYNLDNYLFQFGYVSLLSLLIWNQNGHTQPSADAIDVDNASTVAFVNVTIVSMQNEEVLHKQTVIILGDRIQSIGPVDAQFIPPEAKVIDGSGQYLIPGLADMHVHVDVPFENGPLFLNAGYYHSSEPWYTRKCKHNETSMAESS